MLGVIALGPGCAYLPVPGPTVGTIVLEGTLEDLLGSSKSKIRDQLGMPQKELEYPDEKWSYFVYTGTASFGFMMASDGRQASGDWASKTQQCTLLAFDADDHLVRFQVESVAPSKDCLNKFGMPEEVLTSRAERGDKEAAIQLARRFHDPGPLKKLAEHGDAEAAIELADWYIREDYRDVQPQEIELQGNTFGIFDKPGEGRLVVTDTINRFEKLPLNQFELAAQVYFERSNRRCTIESAKYLRQPTLTFEFFYSCAT